MLIMEDSIQTTMVNKMLEKIDVMDLKKGHETKYFDPENKSDVNKMMKFIKDKINDGYYFYAAKKSGEYYVINKPNEIKEKDLERFLLAKRSTKRLITPPVTGG